MNIDSDNTAFNFDDREICEISGGVDKCADCEVPLGPRNTYWSKNVIKFIFQNLGPNLTDWGLLALGPKIKYVWREWSYEWKIVVSLGFN